jgi:hypothetical protein
VIVRDLRFVRSSDARLSWRLSRFSYDKR